MLRYALLSYVMLVYGPSVGQSRETAAASRSSGRGISPLIGGNAPVFSLNYHQTLRWFRRPADQADCGSVEMGLGLGVTPQLLGRSVVTVPHHLSVNYGGRFFRGEVGYGATNGRRGVLFERAGYQPGVITGFRITPTPHLSVRLFAWSTFHQKVQYLQDAQFRAIERKTQYIRVFPGVSTVYHFNG